MTLRPETPEDEPFLRRLFTLTRPFLPSALLEMQFQAQRSSYRSAFPDGEFWIVELEGEPIGNLSLARGEATHLIDIALLPEHRGRGIGTGLLRELLEKGPVTLQVEATNPARRLYERMGFEETGSDGVYVQMRSR